MESDASYDRGRVDEKLAGHDRHFEQINGSMKDVAANLAKNNLLMQRIIDSAAADRATVLTTAKALKDADDARRDKGEQKWTPIQRLALVLGALAAVAGVTITLLTAVH